VFLMRQYYMTIPDELCEAARIDGLSEYGIWARVILPLSKPALASLALLTFVNTWNDYMGPFIYLTSNRLWTVQLGLRSFVGQFDAEYAMIMTGSVISVIPILIIFLLGQRYFIQGIATSGMKG
jgi:multiple sugar transport system permease protein